MKHVYLNAERLKLLLGYVGVNRKNKKVTERETEGHSG